MSICPVVADDALAGSALPPINESGAAAIPAPTESLGW
jgi:hypothetical protein